MENSISVNLAPWQVVLSLVFQIWIIVFPVIIIRKLNYLTDLLHAQFDTTDDKESA